MFFLTKTLKIFLNYLIICILSMVIFTLIILTTTQSTIFNNNYQRNLFSNLDVYTNLQQIVETLKTNLRTNLGINKNTEDKQTQAMLSILENSTKPSLMKSNIDDIRDEIFDFFEGSRRTLPDITIDTDTGSNDQINTRKKINISTIFSYTDINYLKDMIYFTKLIYYLVNKLPFFLLLIFLATISSYYFFYKDYSKLFKLLKQVLIINAILITSFAIFIIYYLNNHFPTFIKVLTINISITTAFFTNYISKVLIDSTKYLFLHLIIFAIIILLINYIYNFLNRIFLTKEILIISKIKKHKNIAYFSFPLILILLIYIDINNIKNDFEKNDFKNIYSKIVFNNMTTEVIPAKDDSIYILQIKLFDQKDNKPIDNVSIDINGYAKNFESKIKKNLKTDKEGLIKTSLEKGNYKLSILDSPSLIKYQIPSTSFFEMSKPGTTILSIPLSHKITEVEVTPKVNFIEFVEVEIIDDQNLPVQNITLEASSIDSQNSSSKLFSITNSDGIGVFKLEKGSYNISINLGKDLIDLYNAQPKFQIDIAPIEGNLIDKVDTQKQTQSSIYTIKLVKKK